MLDLARAQRRVLVHVDLRENIVNYLLLLLAQVLDHKDQQSALQFRQLLRVQQRVQRLIKVLFAREIVPEKIVRNQVFHADTLRQNAEHELQNALAAFPQPVELEGVEGQSPLLNRMFNRLNRVSLGIWRLSCYQLVSHHPTGPDIASLIRVRPAHILWSQEVHLLDRNLGSHEGLVIVD